MEYEEKALKNDDIDEEKFILPEELLLNSMLLFEEEDSSEEKNAQESEKVFKGDESKTLNIGCEANETAACKTNKSDASKADACETGESDNTYGLELDVERRYTYYQKVKKELSMYLLKRQQITENLRNKKIIGKKKAHVNNLIKNFDRRRFNKKGRDKRYKKLCIERKKNKELCIDEKKYKETFRMDIGGFELEKNKLSIDYNFNKKHDGLSMKI